MIGLVFFRWHREGVCVCVPLFFNTTKSLPLLFVPPCCESCPSALCSERASCLVGFRAVGLASEPKYQPSTLRRKGIVMILLHLQCPTTVPARSGLLETLCNGAMRWLAFQGLEGTNNTGLRMPGNMAAQATKQAPRLAASQF